MTLTIRPRDRRGDDPGGLREGLPGSRPAPSREDERRRHLELLREIRAVRRSIGRGQKNVDDADLRLDHLELSLLKLVGLSESRERADRVWRHLGEPSPVIIDAIALAVTAEGGLKVSIAWGQWKRHVSLPSYLAGLFIALAEDRPGGGAPDGLIALKPLRDLALRRGKLFRGPRARSATMSEYLRRLRKAFLQAGIPEGVIQLAGRMGARLMIRRSTLADATVRSGLRTAANELEMLAGSGRTRTPRREWGTSTRPPADR